MTHRAIEVVGTGFAVLDRLYTNERKSFEAVGGSCGNVLVSLAMLNHAVAPLLTLGFDEIGESLIDEFAQAGADTSYIFRRRGLASPVVAQRLDTVSGQHCFSFICPETDERLPAYRPIEPAEAYAAKSALNACAVFYADRVSEAILAAMETAARASAIVYFEPSSIDDGPLFERALRLATILKFSSERLSDRIESHQLPVGAISIVTHGARGLELRQGERREWCNAIPAAVVRDTCGAGDMVTVGVIDWLLGRLRHKCYDISIESLLEGVIAGQRLAAANCAFAGARGLFRFSGPKFARMVLDNRFRDEFPQFD